MYLGVFGGDQFPSPHSFRRTFNLKCHCSIRCAVQANLSKSETILSNQGITLTITILVLLTRCHRDRANYDMSFPPPATNAHFSRFWKTLVPKQNWARIELENDLLEFEQRPNVWLCVAKYYNVGVGKQSTYLCSIKGIAESMLGQ